MGKIRKPPCQKENGRKKDAPVPPGARERLFGRRAGQEELRIAAGMAAARRKDTGIGIGQRRGEQNTARRDIRRGDKIESQLCMGKERIDDTTGAKGRRGTILRSN